MHKTLHPESTAEQNKQRNELLAKGYYPAGPMPKDIFLRIPVVQGPGFTAGPGALPKIPSGTVDLPSRSVPTQLSPGNVPWCPVVYVLLYRSKTLPKKGMTPGPKIEYRLRDFVLDIEVYKDNRRKQLAFITTYLLSRIAEDKDSDTLRLSIDAAINLLSKEKT